MYIRILDNDRYYYTSEDFISFNELIDEIFIEVPTSVGLRSNNETFVGVNQLATLVLTYTLACSENYYGSNCSKFCKPHNDSIGQYNCDPLTGDKLCLPGYKNPDIYCTEGEYANETICIANKF